MHLQQFGLQRFRQDHVAEPPAAHRVGFREGEAVNHSVGKIGLAGEVEDAVGVLIGEMAVGVVQQDENIVRTRNRADTQKLVAAENPAGRIGRRDENDRFGFRRDQLFQLFRVELPVAGLIERPVDGFAAAQADLLDMRGEAGVGDDDLVARIQQHMQDGVDALHVPRRDMNLAVRVDGGTRRGPVRFRDERPQFGESVRKRVFADIGIRFQRLPHGGPDMRGGLEGREAPGKRRRALFCGASHRHLLYRRDSHRRNGGRNARCGILHSALLRIGAPSGNGRHRAGTRPESTPFHIDQDKDARPSRDDKISSSASREETKWTRSPNYL